MDRKMTMYNILTREGYFGRFFELCEEYNTYRAAYEALEEELFLLTQTTRYSSYESFKTIKTRYLKNLPKLRNSKQIVNNVYQCPACKDLICVRAGEYHIVNEGKESV